MVGKPEAAVNLGGSSNPLLPIGTLVLLKKDWLKNAKKFGDLAWLVKKKFWGSQCLQLS